MAVAVDVERVGAGNAGEFRQAGAAFEPDRCARRFADVDEKPCRVFAACSIGVGSGIAIAVEDRHAAADEVLPSARIDVLDRQIGGAVDKDRMIAIGVRRRGMGEPYRTLLGHLRHETGHYFEHILVETGPGAERYLDRCRDLFGDERASYADAINRHYRFGAPENWHESFISEYATMHPWEDFAECFAHYLHITGTIDTARESGLNLDAQQVRFTMDRDIVPLRSYADEPIERLLYDWKWLSLMLNRVNVAMGRRPLYPFTIPEPVVRKLGFVHEVIRESARRAVTTDPLVVAPAQPA